MEPRKYIQSGGDDVAKGKYLSAYEYPKIDADKNTSDSPTTELNSKISTTNRNQQALINLTEGRSVKLPQYGGSHKKKSHL